MEILFKNELHSFLHSSRMFVDDLIVAREFPSIVKSVSLSCLMFEMYVLNGAFIFVFDLFM